MGKKDYLKVLEILTAYKCRVNLRESHKGNLIKPKCKKLDGMILRLECMWACGDDESYPREFALGGGNFEESVKALGDADIGWLASGDVEVLEIISREKVGQR